MPQQSFQKQLVSLCQAFYCDIGSLMADAQVAENRIKNIRESQSKSGFHEDI